MTFARANDVFMAKRFGNISVRRLNRRKLRMEFGTKHNNVTPFFCLFLDQAWSNSEFQSFLVKITYLQMRILLEVESLCLPVQLTVSLKLF